MNQLAIVIPAYRRRFLAAALSSLARQTDQRFFAYVFDDASPENLRQIYQSVFPNEDNSRFHRFDSNLGGVSLVEHWNRCVEATDGEPWVWLFSDDDVAGSRCVERFQLERIRLEPQTNICRYNTATIDISGAITALHPPHPQVETVESFVYHRLTFQRKTFAPEYIFRRAAYAAHGGFIRFPFALGSDDASWITFAEQTPIVTLQGAMVYWRFTGENVSLLQGARAEEKVLALADFSDWLQKRFQHSYPVHEGELPLKIDMPSLAREWFITFTRNLPANFGYFRAFRLAIQLQRRGLGSWGAWLIRLWLTLCRSQLWETMQRIRRVPPAV